MNETQAVARMQQLIAEINRASYAYYVLDNPIMSDKEWDRLYYELLDLDIGKCVMVCRQHRHTLHFITQLPVSSCDKNIHYS